MTRFARGFTLGNVSQVRGYGIWLAVCGLLALPLAVLPLPYALVLIAGAVVAVLVVVEPVWALYLAVLSVPVQEVIHLPGGLSVTQATLLLVVGAWGLRILAYPERAVTIGPVGLALGGLVWALALSAALTPYSRTEGLKETLRWSTVALIYLLTVNSLRTPQGHVSHWRVGGLVVCLLLAPATTALLGVWQFFAGAGPDSFRVAEDFVRSYGTIGQPNSFAGYMNMTWPLALALALEAGRSWLFGPPSQRSGLFVGLIGFSLLAMLLLLALVSSFSRGGWVGAMGGAAVLAGAFIVALDPQLRRRIWGAAGVAVVAVVVLLSGGAGNLLPDAVAERAASITRNLRLFDVREVTVTPENFAVVERMAHLQAGWDMLTTHPITGVGTGNYTLAYEGQGESGVAAFSTHPWYTSRGHAHNYYLHMAAEAGLIGLFAYLLLLALLVWQGYRALQAANGWFWRGIAIGGCGVIAAVATHNLFENLHVLNMGIQLGALWGMLSIGERKTRVA